MSYRRLKYNTNNTKIFWPESIGQGQSIKKSSYNKRLKDLSTVGNQRIIVVCRFYINS